jgi:hypothetical protein
LISITTISHILRCKEIKLKGYLDLDGDTNPIIAGVGVMVANEAFKGNSK